MFLDAFGLVSDGQALSGTGGVSTDSVDLGAVTPRRAIGTGEAVGFGMTVDVGLAGTTPTFNAEVISATDAALTAGIVVHAQYTRVTADLAVGTQHFFPVPPGTPTQRYLGLRYNLGGTTPTITVTAWLTAHKLFSILAKSYAKGYAV